MSKKNHLLIGRTIFMIFFIIAFGLIIMNEKGGIIFKEKANKKIDQYIDNHYQDIINDFHKGETTYKNNTFQKKISSKKNKNLYFYVQYQNKKCKDTFQKDYEEGSSLFQYLNKKLEKEIEKQTKIKCKIKPTQKLNHYSQKVQERILKEEDLLSLKYYYLQTEILIKDWNKEEITKEIENIITKMNQHNITPKYYEITIINAKDITISIKISNLTEEFPTLENKEDIIEDILNNDNNNQIEKRKITFEYEN